MAMSGRPIFIQCGYWRELCSPYEVARPSPILDKIVRLRVQKFYPILGLGSGEKVPMAFPDSTSVLDEFQSANVEGPPVHVQEETKCRHQKKQTK